MPQHKSKNLPQELTSERGKTHGDWNRQAKVARQLKFIIRENSEFLTAQQIEALEMIQVKTSRILCGDPSEPDHWDDIAGYATLAAQRIAVAPATRTPPCTQGGPDPRMI